MQILEEKNFVIAIMIVTSPIHNTEKLQYMQIKISYS